MAKNKILEGMPAELAKSLTDLQRDLHRIRYKREIERYELREVYKDTVNDIAGKTGAKKPDGVDILFSGMNGMAVEDKKGRKAIIITDGAAKALLKEEREAIVAHEMAHLENDDLQKNLKRDAFFKDSSYGVALLTFGLGNILENVWNAGSIYQAGFREGLVLSIAVGIRYIMDTVAAPISLMKMRKGERAADEASIKAAGVSATIRMLSKLDIEMVDALDELLRDKPEKQLESAGAQDNSRTPWQLRMLLDTKALLDMLRDKVYELRHRDHPSASKRLEYAIEFAKKNGINS